MGAIDGTHITCTIHWGMTKQVAIGRGGPHRMSLHAVHSTSSSSISLVEQMVPPQMQHFLLMHAPLIYLYHQASITLPMQGFLPAIYLWYRTDKYGTISQNGAMLILGELSAVLAPFLLSCHSGQSPRKNYSTFGILVHVTPLNESLVCSNYGSASSHIPQNTVCVSKHKSHPP
jgi:hypothetical protein